MKRILIVDDAFELGRLLQTVFLTLDPGLSIQVVPSAEEALLELTRKPLDLLVSDIRLPGMTGFDLVKKIRARHPTIKVLFISGLADTNLAERAREMKAEGFFRKPLDMTSFLNAARQCLEIPIENPLNPVRTDTAPVKLVITPPSGLSGVPAAPAAPPELLPDLVTGLRQRLGAQAVFVLDERGRIVAQAGDVPDLPLEEKWVGPVMAALNSAEKVARLVGETPVRHVMAFPGKTFNLVMAPAGDYALLVLLQTGRSMLRMALAVEEALEAQQSLGDTLAAIRRQAAPPAEVIPPQPEVVLPPTSPLAPAERPAIAMLPDPALQDQSLMDFEVLLNQSAEKLKDKDIDGFWDRLSAKGLPGAAVNPDVLSYDQARKLGLTPKEEK